jgi:hypothetical protein
MYMVKNKDKVVNDLKDIRALGIVDSPVVKENSEEDFVEPMSLQEFTKILRMLVSEGRKREKLIYEVQKALRDVRDAQDEDRNELLALKNSFTGAPAAAPKARQVVRYGDHLLELMADGLPHTGYDLEARVNAYVTQYGARPVTPDNIGATLSRLTLEGKLTRVAANVYKKLGGTDE